MKTLLITGAAKQNGIGIAAARRLLLRGHNVIVSARDRYKAEQAAEMAGIGVGWVVLDLNDEESIAAAVADIGESHGRLDVLVNNAAILLDHYCGMEELDPAALMRTFETNVVGTFRVTRAFLPLLRESDDPRVINLSSGAGQLDGEPQAWAPAYSISKTALNMLTQQWTAALPGIAFNSMCPGWCRTEMGGEDAPLTPEEGADTVEWLALDAPRNLRGKFVKQRQVIPW